MSWDDNWARALVTVLAAALGAIIAGAINAYAANRKIREIELQYLFKRRDTYIDNARSVMGEVYIPISVALTKLSNIYGRYQSMVGAPQQTAVTQFRDEFESACLAYLGAMEELLARGADAYLTTSIDESLNAFNTFLRGSLDNQHLVKRRVLETTVSLMGLRMGHRHEDTQSATSRLSRTNLPSISLSTFGIGFRYTEKILSAPIETAEFEARFRRDVVRLKFLVKEVTLGSTAPKIM